MDTGAGAPAGLPFGRIVPSEHPKVTLNPDQSIGKKPTDKISGEPTKRIVLEIFKVLSLSESRLQFEKRNSTRRLMVNHLMECCLTRIFMSSGNALLVKEMPERSIKKDMSKSKEFVSELLTI